MSFDDSDEPNLDFDGFDDLDGTGDEHSDPVESEKPRYYCAGYARKLPDGTRVCKYKARDPWAGRCPSCGRFYDCKALKRNATEISKTRGTLADDVEDLQHVPTEIKELDFVMGGGVVYGNVALLGGERGTGKTRMLLRAVDSFAKPGRRAMFISGEDTKQRVQQFAKQLGIKNPDVEVLGDPQGITIDTLPDLVRGKKIKLAVFDSVQALAYSDRKADFGDPAQVKAVCNYLSAFAKATNIAVIMIGQLNAEGNYAGGEALQHGVDILVRFDKHMLFDEEGEPVPGSEDLLRLWIDGKSRQGSAKNEAFMVMNDEGRPESPPRHLQKYLSSIEMI
jgi:hypothetical protein